VKGVNKGNQIENRSDENENGREKIRGREIKKEKYCNGRIKGQNI